MTYEIELFSTENGVGRNRTKSEIIGQKSMHRGMNGPEQRTPVPESLF